MLYANLSMSRLVLVGTAAAFWQTFQNEVLFLVPVNAPVA